MEHLETAWNNIEKLKIFEIEVVDTRTNETEFLTFDLELEPGYALRAYHVPMTEQEEKSEFLTYCQIDLCQEETIDEHLQELDQECIEVITESEFFELK